jgi:chemotaxis protein CheX
MDVNCINPFVKSIANVFSTMLSTEVTFGKPYVKTPTDPRPDVSGVIGLSGDVTGVVILGFKMPVAIKVASKFASLELTSDHPDFADALGELANMVAGGAKANMTGLDANISLPSVIVGENHEVVKSKANPSLVIPCKTPFGDFSVEVAMKIEKPATVGVG